MAAWFPARADHTDSQPNQEGSGNGAIRAASFAEVESIRKRFESLSPWRKTLKTPFLKLEKENFDADGHRQRLIFYGISAKLYCLFNLGEPVCWSANPPATVWDTFMPPIRSSSGSDAQAVNGKGPCHRGFTRPGILSSRGNSGSRIGRHPG